jgi:hypothetical protein
MTIVARCRWCRRQLGNSEAQRQRYQLQNLGLVAEVHEQLLPSCAACLKRKLGEEPRTPPDFLRRLHVPVYVFEFTNDQWPGFHDKIQQEKVSFVCVRRTPERLLLVTRLRIEGTKPSDAQLAARLIEQAILARPRGLLIRFQASRDWGGSVDFAPVLVEDTP